MFGRSRVALMVALLALGGPVAGAVADPGHSVQRPFALNMDALVSVAPVQRCPGELTLELVLNGTATHLGRFGAIGTHCTLPTLAIEAVPLHSGVATFTAADGSTLAVTYEGWQDTPVSGVASVTFTIEIVSGTGRFADAAGSWTGTGTLDLATFTGGAEARGWIRY